VDYRRGEQSVVADVQNILACEGLNKTIRHIFDAVSEGESLDATLRLINPDAGVIATVLPPKMFAKSGDDYQYPANVTAINTACPRVLHKIKILDISGPDTWGVSWLMENCTRIRMRSFRED
jgi:hypothetical protein